VPELVHREYAGRAEGDGLRIEACPPADPTMEEIGGAGVKYVKGNFVPARMFRDLADLKTGTSRMSCTKRSAHPRHHS
jgi:hypothetical protein